MHSVDFGIEEKPCYFCEQPKTVGFNEHYTFCPSCSAIYTTLIMESSSCEHMVDGTPVVVRLPWYSSTRKKAYIKETKTEQQCSECRAICLFDGW